MDFQLRQAALDFHEFPKPEKLKKNAGNQLQLSEI